jgi:hypothetical protein
MSKSSASSSGGSDMNKTQASGGGGNDMDKTQVFGGGSPSSAGGDDKTQVFGSGSGGGDDKTQVFGAPQKSSSSASKTPDFSRTFIGGMETESDESVAGAKKEAPRASRKIKGWIVSFTLDAMGVDYRIFEGSNTIGRDPSNSITITKDSTMSSNHANILFRAGKFYISDEMSANGSYLNGEEMEIRKPYDLVDGDDIRLGDTVFKFKACN